jgi:DNA-binding transcriptional ArsR family regulator
VAKYMTIATAPRDQLSATFAALADPTRRAILARLVQGEAPVKELAEPFKMTLPAVSKHLKVLERAQLIERSRHAQWRPCRLAPEPLKEVADWVDRYRVLWEDRFDRLEDYLSELQRISPSHPQPTGHDELTGRRAAAEEEHDDRKR